MLYSTGKGVRECVCVPVRVRLRVHLHVCVFCLENTPGRSAKMKSQGHSNMTFVM